MHQQQLQARAESEEPEDSGSGLPATQAQPQKLSGPPWIHPVGAEVPTLEPVREAGGQEEPVMQQFTSREACPWMRKGGTTCFAHTSSLQGATLLFIPQITFARAQEEQWQCSLQNLHPSTARLAHTKKEKTHRSSYCLQDFHLLIILLYSPPTFVFVCLTGQVYSGFLDWHISFAVLT